MVDTFYTKSLSEEGMVQLNPEESFHLATVLRKKEGDMVLLFDGLGNKSFGKIVQVDKKCSIIHNSTITYDPIEVFHSIAIAPTKNIDRFEYFLEKSVEIGIQAIFPILTKHSERKVINHERLEKIVLAAAKQCGTAHLPILHPLQPFSNAISTIHAAIKLIATCDGETKPFHEMYVPNQNSIIFVGPEGDFSKEEVEKASQAAYTPVSLGKNRLRVETAGILICAQAVLLNQK